MAGKMVADSSKGAAAADKEKKQAISRSMRAGLQVRG